MEFPKKRKRKVFLLVGDNIIKNNLTHIGYTQREKIKKKDIDEEILLQLIIMIII